MPKKNCLNCDTEFMWHPSQSKGKYCCNECGISEYNSKPIRLQIDHIDGNNKNDTIENYRYLCPNCHTQTDTWGVKNVSEEGKKRMTEAAYLGNKIRHGKMPIGSRLD